jgi:cytochrome oxidase Cu insertion factor (SCO1/SenC/PrrC family)
MATMRECPVCGIRVKLENLEVHLKNVHPRVEVDATLTKEDKTAIKVVKKKKQKQMQPFEERERRRWIMAGALIVVIVVVIIALMSILPPGPGNCSIEDLKGESPPEIDVGDVAGNQYVLYDHIGDKPILIEFFYTECLWCKNISPHLNAVYANYGYGDQLEIVSISADPEDSVQTVRAFKEYHNSDWTFIWDSSFTLDDDYCVEGTPSLFLIGMDGNVVEVIHGYKNSTEMIEIIDPYV